MKFMKTEHSQTLPQSFNAAWSCSCTNTSTTLYNHMVVLLYNNMVVLLYNNM